MAGAADTGAGRAPDLGVVVNHFALQQSGEEHGLLVATATVTLRLLTMNPVVGTTLLVDGSPKPDGLMREACQEAGATYHHEGREISYSEGYNLGWRSLGEPYVGLIANDVLPHPIDSVARLLDWVRKPDVGCAVPYVTTHRPWRDEVQAPGFLKRGRRTCEPSSMALNFALFDRTGLEAIGGIDESFRGGFAEPILMAGLRARGQRVVLVGKTRAFHYDRLTKEVGQSRIDADTHRADARQWFREYPELAHRNGLANIDLSRWPLATTRRIQAMWWLIQHWPLARSRKSLIRLGLALEPTLTRYPASRGCAPPASTGDG